MSSIIKVGKVQSSTGQDAVTVADSGAITATGALTASGGIKVNSIKDQTGTKTFATLSNSAITFSSDVTTTNSAISAFTLSSANSSTGVTSKDFTGIPSWHRHIYLFFNSVSFSDGSDLIMQLGYGETPTYQTSGYLTSQTSSIQSQATATNGFGVIVSSAGRTFTGMNIFTRMNDTTYYWQCHMGGHTNVPIHAFGEAILSSGPATAIKAKLTSSGGMDSGTMYAGWE